ncbi:MAG TPA: SDR family oxidoreductase [Deltaproteobacteria bacterium]|nr:SDR family oxidoreductase [Deltaproteobacteria bacterium]HQA71486.1 SDR family oxidoreductase [Deltaproteobacteria bacterium]
MEISGSKALVTGAASGIGRAISLKMSEAGARLFLTDINASGLEQTRRMITDRGGEVLVSLPLDIGDFSGVKGLADTIHSRFGPLDILVNVAGMAIFSQVEDMLHADWEKIVRVNLWGPIHGIECFVPEMIRSRRPGHVVSIASTAGIIALPWQAAYSGTKHALVGISESLRFDLKKHGIGVTVVCPGAVNTGLVQTAQVQADRQAVERLRRLFLKLAMQPEKVAGLTIDAIRKNRFLVLTSADIMVLYFLKRALPPLYRLFMQLLTKFMDRSLRPAGTA